MNGMDSKNRKEEDSRSFLAQRKQHAKSYVRRGTKQKDDVLDRRVRRMKMGRAR